MTAVEIIGGNQLKDGDTSPPLRLKLIDEVGNPMNITGWSAELAVRYVDEQETSVIAPVDIIRPEEGLVEYDWQPDDLNTLGTYEAEVRATDGSDHITFPNDRYFHVRVMEDL